MRIEAYKKAIERLEKAIRGNAKHSLVIKLYHRCESLESACIQELEKVKNSEKAEYKNKLYQLQNKFIRLMNDYFDRL